MSNFLGYGSPEALEEAIKASKAEDDDFIIYAEGLGNASVCSSLPLEEVKERMAAVITGLAGGWVFAEGERFSDDRDNPCPCNQRPATHKHYLFHC